MTESQKVSVIINNYNYANFLVNAIESVLNQTYNNIELIVVDDGSTDTSHDVISNYKGQLIAIFKENENHTSTLNVGFQVSTGDIVCFLDSDDSFVENKVENIVNVFQCNPNIGWCFHPLLLICAYSGKVITQTRSFPKLSKDLSTYCDFRQNLKDGHLGFYAPSTSGLCFSKKLLESILPMPIKLEQAGDRFITSLAIYKSPGYFLNSALTLQSIHKGNEGTFQNSRYAKKKKSRNQIAMAYYLRQQCPETYKYCDRAIARGIYGIWTSGGHILDSKYLLEEYLQDSSFFEKLIIYVAVLYKTRPWKNNKLYVYDKNRS